MAACLTYMELVPPEKRPTDIDDAIDVVLTQTGNFGDPRWKDVPRSKKCIKYLRYAAVVSVYKEAIIEETRSRTEEQKADKVKEPSTEHTR